MPGAAFAPVRRGHALEDGFAAFGAQGGPALRGRLRTIERLTRVALTEVAIPSPADVAAHRARATLPATWTSIPRSRSSLS